MITSLHLLLVVVGLVRSSDDSTGLVRSSDDSTGNDTETTTRLWKRKKPAYWEFPMTSSTEKPDISAEYCKDVDMVDLGKNITDLVNEPLRGKSDDLLQMIVTYVLTLHRFIRKTNTTDDVAIRMAKDLVKTKRPKFLDMELDLPQISKRIGFDQYELQHFQWVLEDIQKSWQKLKGILFGEEGEL